MRKTAALLILTLCLSGCSSEKLQLYSIVTAAAFDMDENGYVMTIEESSGQSEDGKELVPSVSSGQGKTVTECFQDMQAQTGKTPYLRHTVLLIFSENIVKNSMQELGNYILNDNDIRLNTRVMACKGKAGGIFEGEDFQSRRILKTTTGGAENMTSADIMLKDLLYCFYEEGIDGVLPLTSSESTGGLALLNGFDWAGELEPGLVPAFLIASGRAERGSITARVGERWVSFDLTSCKSDMKAYIENGRAIADLSVKISLKAEDRLTEGREECQAAVKNKLEKEIAEMFDILRFSGSDALGLGQYLYRYDTETWQKVAQSWKDTYYSQSLCRVNVQVELESSGKMKEAG